MSSQDVLYTKKGSLFEKCEFTSDKSSKHIHIERRITYHSRDPIQHNITEYKCNPKKHFLTGTERKFFYLLNHCKPENSVIVTKTRLIDLVYCDESSPFFYSILAMHVDFVIMKYPEMIALLAIELDDPSHLTRTNTDTVKDNILKNNSIPLLRVKSNKFYPISRLKDIINTAIETSK